MIDNNIKELCQYLNGYKYNLLVVLTALITVAASLLLMGGVLRRLIDLGLADEKLSQVNNSIYLIILLIIILAIGSFCRSYSIYSLSLKIVSQIKLDTYGNLLKLDIVKFEDLKIGDIILRLSSDTDNINSLIVNFFSFFIRNVTMFIGAVILMFLQSTKLTLLVLLVIPILLFPLLKLSKYVRKLSRQISSHHAMIVSYMEEDFNAIRTIYAYNQQTYSLNKFRDRNKCYTQQADKRLKFRSLFFVLAIGVIASVITFVIWVGSVDIINGNLSSGTMISFIYYSIIAGMSFGGIAEFLTEIQSNLASLGRVFDLKNISQNAKQLKPETEPTYIQNANATIQSLDTNISKIIDLHYSIKFQKLCFAYPTRPDIAILNNINLDIEEGKFTAIIGESGSGKTTLMQLILKFYDYQSGTILIGNHNIQDIPNHIIRSKIAYVEQYPAIFSGSIRSNIAISKPDANQDDILRLAKLCGILDFTNNLKNGLDTEIGEKGVRLSGGQKQRIAIARGLLYNPEMLFLDEATSALDYDNQEMILSNILSFMKGKTIVSIAHRKSAIINADTILTIDNGHIL